MAIPDLKGKWALITGASSGFGRDYAELLAGMGLNLVVTARREDRLIKLKKKIESANDVRVEVVICDLAVHGQAVELRDQLQSQEIEVEVLINNAGLGVYGMFSEISQDQIMEMLQVDVVALTELTKVFSEQMITRRSGYILLVSSIAAYQPSPTYAVYAAAKSYVLSLGEALNYELKPHGVSVSVVSPGVTATEFFEVAGQKLTFFQRMSISKSMPVAKKALQAMFAGSPNTIPGLMNKMTVFLTKIVPSEMKKKIVYLTMKN